jgi:hypothetical protein
MIGWTLGILAAAAVLVVGGWVYVTSRVEQPKYAAVLQDGAIEVRDYPALVVAEVTRRGERWPAVNAGFRPLAGYIFARERPGPAIPMTAPVTQQREPIAMTAPVTQTAGQDGETWAIRFIMPAGTTVETLPKPANADVRLLTLPATRRAAIRFSGVATDERIAEQEARLRACLEARGTKVAGSPTYAYYNDPWTPGPLRRNEVLFDLAGG